MKSLNYLIRRVGVGAQWRSAPFPVDVAVTPARHRRAGSPWRRVLSVVLSAGLALAAAPALAVDVGDTVTLPSLTLLDGKTLSASALKDRTVIVEYWASWCPFCAQQNPHLQKLYEATRGKPIQIVTLSIDKKPQEALDYMKAHGYTFPAGMENDAWQATLGKRRGLPELYVIGRNGKVLRKEVGEMFGEDVAALADYAGK
ncbi:TlpA family protein disulfide reductase [Pandoraea apista]|uniref:TlpA family protein disulfide reductase n=1 Tax=Pandoraea apista TaxID=93218 RepID=UPI0026783076|nr:TlpA disulfide reductase family protein [Pandoraea apista]